MTSIPDPVRTAHARLASLRRWRPTDTAAIAEARRALVVAQAAVLTRQAAALLTEGEDAR